MSSQPSTKGELSNSGEDNKNMLAVLKARKTKQNKKAKWEFQKKRLRAHLLVCGSAELRVAANFITICRSKNIFTEGCCPSQELFFPVQLFQSSSPAPWCIYFLEVKMWWEASDRGLQRLGGPVGQWWGRSSCGDSGMGTQPRHSLAGWEMGDPSSAESEPQLSLLLGVQWASGRHFNYSSLRWKRK